VFTISSGSLTTETVDEAYLGDYILIFFAWQGTNEDFSIKITITVTF